MSFILCQHCSKCTNWLDPFAKQTLQVQCLWVTIVKQFLTLVTFLKTTLHFIRAPATQTAIELRGDSCWHCRALMVIYIKRNTRMATYFVQSLWMRPRKKDRKQCEKHWWKINLRGATPVKRVCCYTGEELVLTILKFISKVLHH